MFLLLLRDISWGFRHLAPNFLFTSLVWQPSCRLGIKQKSAQQLNCIIPLVWGDPQCLVTYFPAIFVGFADRMGHAAFWWKIHWNQGRESNYLASASRGGAMLDRCPLVDAPDLIVLSLFRQERSLKTTTHAHCVFCNLYNHWLLISQILDIESSDLPVRSLSPAVNPRGFPEGFYLGWWLLPGATCKSILPSSQPLCNLQVRCLDPGNGNSYYLPRFRWICARFYFSLEAGSPCWNQSLLGRE